MAVVGGNWNTDRVFTCFEIRSCFKGLVERDKSWVDPNVMGMETREEAQRAGPRVGQGGTYGHRGPGQQPRWCVRLTRRMFPQTRVPKVDQLLDQVWGAESTRLRGDAGYGHDCGCQLYLPLPVSGHGPTQSDRGESAVDPETCGYPGVCVYETVCVRLCMCVHVCLCVWACM